MGWQAMQHSFDAYVFIYIRPMDTLTIADNFKILPLFIVGFR